MEERERERRSAKRTTTMRVAAATTTTTTTTTTSGQRVLLVCACGVYEEEEEEEDDARKATTKIGIRFVTNSTEKKGCWSAIRARGGRDDDDENVIVEINGEPCVRFFSAKKHCSDDATVVAIRAVGFASSRKHHHECCCSSSEKNNEPLLLLSGWNQFGQLGDGSCQSRAPSDFRPVPLFERMRVRVRKVALGLFHSVVLCEGGSVYGFGANPQIGAPKEVKYSTVPRLIEGGDLRDDDEDDEIEFIGCGSRHTLVASKRRAFAFGCNAKRQCGFAPPDANDEDDFEDEEERHNVYLPRETLSSSSATTIAFVRCERWSSFVGVVVQR